MKFLGLSQHSDARIEIFAQAILGSMILHGCVHVSFVFPMLSVSMSQVEIYMIGNIAYDAQTAVSFLQRSHICIPLWSIQRRIKFWSTSSHTEYLMASKSLLGDWSRLFDESLARRFDFGTGDAHFPTELGASCIFLMMTLFAEVPIYNIFITVNFLAPIISFGIWEFVNCLHFLVIEIAQLLHSDSPSLVQLVLELFTEGSVKLFLKF